MSLWVWRLQATGEIIEVTEIPQGVLEYGARAERRS